MKKLTIRIRNWVFILQTHQFGMAPKSKSESKETKLLKYVAEGKLFNKDDAVQSSSEKYEVNVTLRSNIQVFY